MPVLHAVHLCFCLDIDLSGCISVCISGNLAASTLIWLSGNLTIHLAIWLLSCTSVIRFDWTSACLHIHLHLSVSAHLAICSAAYAFVCQPVLPVCSATCALFPAHLIVWLSACTSVAARMAALLLAAYLHVLHFAHLLVWPLGNLSGNTFGNTSGNISGHLRICLHVCLIACLFCMLICLTICLLISLLSQAVLHLLVLLFILLLVGCGSVNLSAGFPAGRMSFWSSACSLVHLLVHNLCIHLHLPACPAHLFYSLAVLRRLTGIS
jgi:hypothetical protein